MNCHLFTCENCKKDGLPSKCTLKPKEIEIRILRAKEYEILTKKGLRYPLWCQKCIYSKFGEEGLEKSDYRCSWCYIEKEFPQVVEYHKKNFHVPTSANPKTEI